MSIRMQIFTNVLLFLTSHASGYEHREFSALHLFENTRASNESSRSGNTYEGNVHYSNIPLEFMSEVYNISVEAATSNSSNGNRTTTTNFVHIQGKANDGVGNSSNNTSHSKHDSHRHHMPVSFPGHIGRTSQPVYNKEFVRKMHEEACTFLVTPNGVEPLPPGTVAAYGWPGLAQSGEDLYAVDKWFFGMTNGVILESGALNGIQFSTSWFFEYFANWTSIHVEADPDSYKQLVSNRPRSVNVHAALCSSQAKQLHYVDSSLAISGIYEFMEPEYVKKWYPDFYEHPDKALSSLPVVHCIPPKLLFATLAIPQIDIWVLDVEGAELEVLKGVDWDRVDIKTIIMECGSTDIIRDDFKMAWLGTKGFTCTKVALISECMCTHDSFTSSYGGVFDGYPFSVSKGGHELFLMDNGKVRSFANMDDYEYFTDNCGSKAQNRKEVNKVYFDTHPRGETMTRPELEQLCIKEQEKLERRQQPQQQQQE